MKEIRGSVAKILNTTQLVINRGSIHGVKIGMIFEVLDKNATDIIDPETKKKLGSIDRPKVRVKVTIVESKLAMAETFQIKTVNRGGTGLSLANVFSPPEYVDVKETFKSAEKAWEDLPEEKSYVKVGDPVRSVEERGKQTLRLEDVL
ncbi:MAG TPA: hypothetical protein PK096_03360 [Candidatus Saccharibacteria bacterium]|nr:hypothetical protein [Candidatus Saccharibacteria bacterium]HRK94381.1 hypothetical protein [Candidatus Saccharibacteria bacterium]